VFEEASPRIAGMIQGAMVLRVSQDQSGLIESSRHDVVVLVVVVVVSVCVEN
jgi:hypothetical protein